ncbi:hypothetical protein SAMN06265375_1011562 [Muriicola jejuensis]|uniref:hypothetical protein n=1 Tax=Muriicola jejuensis TaxID=504488 RepID=UPI0024033030|nr:hypothetical protein SAMN06265375_1011562 [Muriicola jejuensis]
MSVKDKYQPVLTLGEKLGVKDGNVTVEDGILKVKGQAKTQYEKNLIWDKIKETRAFRIFKAAVLTF